MDRALGIPTLLQNASMTSESEADACREIATDLIVCVAGGERERCHRRWRKGWILIEQVGNGEINLMPPAMDSAGDRQVGISDGRSRVIARTDVDALDAIWI